MRTTKLRSFPAATLIHMADGSVRPIAQIAWGDTVLALDPADPSGALRPAQVDALPRPALRPLPVEAQDVPTASLPASPPACRVIEIGADGLLRVVGSSRASDDAAQPDALAAHRALAEEFADLLVVDEDGRLGFDLDEQSRELERSGFVATAHGGPPTWH